MVYDPADQCDHEPGIRLARRVPATESISTRSRTSPLSAASAARPTGIWRSVLKNGAVQKYFSDVGGTDTIVFNPNNRRFYAGAGPELRIDERLPREHCPARGATVPIVGVFDAIGAVTAALDGVACTGRGNHVAGVDPINNVIYVPVSQYPTDPASTRPARRVSCCSGIRYASRPGARSADPDRAEHRSEAMCQGTIAMTLTGTRVRVCGNPDRRHRPGGLVRGSDNGGQ